MAETAVLVVEHRLPAVPWRQQVLSFPGPRRSSSTLPASIDVACTEFVPEG